MKKISLIRRKSLIEAGIPNSHLIHLSQDNQYFKNRTGDTSIFRPYDVLLVFIASELFNYLPFRNVSGVLSDFVRSYPNFYRLLKQNPRQFLVIEKKTDETLKKVGVPMEFYVVYPVLFDTMPVFDWGNHEGMILVNLEKIYLRVEDLFLKEGIEVPTGDVE